MKSLTSVIPSRIRRIPIQPTLSDGAAGGRALPERTRPSATNPNRVRRSFRGPSPALALLLALTSLAPAFAEHAPNLALIDLSGSKQKLTDLRGHIVVVNFWATWCGPCQEELPRLAALAQQWSGQNGRPDVRFVAISIDNANDQAKIRPDLARLHIAPAPNFSIWTGGTSYALASFGLGEVVPGTAILDRDGTIVTRIQGEARDNDVRTTVDWLLKHRAGPPPPATIKRY